MLTAVKFAISVLALVGTCTAQDGLAIDSRHKERVSTAEAEKIYSSACSVVQREFDIKHPLHPQVRLVLGADKNEIWFVGREIRLTKWNRYAFAQGVVWLAFEDLMPSQQRLTIAKRAVAWAGSTVEIERLEKRITGSETDAQDIYQ
jgi:hypothetical protein